MDFSEANLDPVLLCIGVVLVVSAIYLLFLRNSVMWGFLCVVGLIVVGILIMYPEYKFIPDGVPGL